MKSIEICNPIYKKQKIKKQRFLEDRVWKGILSCLLLSGAICALMYSWGSMIPDWRIVTGMTAFAFGSAVCAEGLKKKTPFAGGILAVPWLLFFIVTRFHGYLSGARSWIYMMSIHWNLLEEGGAALLQSGMDGQEILAFSLFIAVLCGEGIWVIVIGHRMLLTGCFCMTWLLVQVCSGTFSPIVGMCLIVGMFGLWSSFKMEFSIRSVIWTTGIGVVLLLSMVLYPQQQMESIKSFRQEVKQTVHEIRYGKDNLPEGELRQAAALQQDEEVELTVQTQQEKNLYLRGFTGGTYDEGVWKKLSGAAYIGENTGMIKWLESQNFYPLSQVSEYYKLGNSEDVPDTNHVEIQVENASRYYVYAPSSVQKISNRKLNDKKEMRIYPKGFFGTKTYGYEETSGSRPAELTVADSWVSEPETEEQKQYCEAESVYRKFVYENYTEPAEDLKKLIQQYFWEDYESESDGIYSALSQIREKLKKGVHYTMTPEEIPESEDPVRWFLTESKEGNSMLYASAAVEAFRVHGIPARYVEGYYVPSTAVADSENGEVTLTGQNAHAWVEVYFDGVGWLPVDVTPGYYYDAVTLQQMVGTPDVVRKKAALEDNSYGADQMGDTQGSGTSTSPRVPFLMKRVGIILLGIAAMFILLFAVVIVAAELLRIVSMWKVRREYQRATKEQRLWLIEKMIYFWLKLRGVESRLGWNTEIVDQQIAEQIEAVKPGQYIRASQLLEKVVYGDILLERYEERTVLMFFKKLCTVDASCNWRMKLKLRYACGLMQLDEYLEKRRMRRRNNELRRNQEM